MHSSDVSVFHLDYYSTTHTFVKEAFRTKISYRLILNWSKYAMFLVTTITSSPTLNNDGQIVFRQFAIIFI